MLEDNPQSRFRLFESMTALPGSCVTCSTHNGPFIDFGFQAEFYGAVAFCLLCAQDLGRAAGLVDNAPITVVTYDWNVINSFEVDICDALNKFRNSVKSISSVLPSVESTGESEVSDSKELGTSDTDSKSTSVEESVGVSSATDDDGLFNDGTDSKSK